MSEDRNTLNFKWFLLLLSVVFNLYGAQPIKGNNTGETVVLKLNNDVEIADLLEKYPHLRTVIQEDNTKKVFQRQEPLKTRVKSLERRRRFGLMSSKQRKKINTTLEAINSDIARIEKHKAKAIKAGTYPNLNTTFKLTPRGTQQQLLALLKTLPEVQYAEPTYTYSTQALPNDTYVDPEQNNEWTQGTLSSSISDMWGLEAINMKNVWNAEFPVTGNEIIVAVIDTGIDPLHEDISNNLWRNESNHYGYDFVNDDNYPVDGHGHGTHVAGTIAAEINNNRGISGVAPGVKIMALKGLSDYGGGSDIDIAQAIEYAADNGADIINMSLGGYGDSSLMEDAVNYAYSLGVIIVAAAGNAAEDASNFHPAGFENVITVASLSTDETLSSFSNYGNTIEVAAPGETIISLRASGTSLGTPLNEFYTYTSGTSMAAPHVAGVLALLKQRYPDYSNDEVSQILYQTATDIGDLGKDSSFGHGKIDAFSAITETTFVFGNITSPSQDGPLNNTTTSIDGSAYSDDFSNYTLSYRHEETDTWTQIIYSNTEVRDGTLGTWNTDTLETGAYYLKLTVSSSSDSADIIKGPFYRDTRVKDGFPITLSGDTLKSYPTLHTTESAVSLIAIASQNMYQLELSDSGLNQTLTPVANSSLYFGYYALNRAATLGDIDQDGSDEILIGGPGTITVIEEDNTKTEHDITTLLGGNFLINKLVLADMNQDSKLDIVFSANGRGLYVLTENTGNLSILSSNWPVLGEFRDPLVVDVNADNSPELVTLSEDGTLYIFDAQGNTNLAQAIGFDSELDEIEEELFIGDIDLNGDLEIGLVKLNFISSQVEYHLFHHDGTQVDGWPFTYSGYYYNSMSAPVIADITGDNVPEVIAAQYMWTGTDLFILSANGEFLHDRTVPIQYEGHYSINSALMIADVNNDEINDILFASSGDKTQIKGINHEGIDVIDSIEIQGIPNAYYTNIGLSVADYDNNNKLDIISIASSHLDNKSVISVHELDTPLQTILLQRLMYRGNEQLTGISKSPFSLTTPLSSLSDYVASADTISFNWTLPGHTPEGIKVIIRAKSEPETILHSATYVSHEVTINELELRPGTTYEVLMQAYSGDEYSLIRTQPIKIDSTGPVLTGVTLTHPSQHTIMITLDAEDPETGIAGLQYSLGNSPGETDIQNITTVDNTSLTLDVSPYVATRLDSLNPTLIYINISALNGADTLSDTVLTTPIDYSYLVPEGPSLADTPRYASDSDLQFIDWEAQKTLFDITTLYYGLGTSSSEPNLINWKAIPADDTRIALLDQNLTHSENYFIFAKLENEYGYSSDVTVKEITVDTTPPTTPELSTNLSIISSLTTTFSITSNDSESGVLRHWIAIGSEIHLNDIVDWQVHELDEVLDISHVYNTTLYHLPYFYIKVKSENAAGLFSDSITHKVSTDIEAPLLSNILINGNTVESNSEFQGFINVSFTATDNINININAVEIRLYDKTNTLISTITPQISYGSVYLARFLDTIESDTGYTIQIQATDDTGNSTYYTSPDFQFINLDIVDTTPPLIHSIKVNDKDVLTNDILKDSLNFTLSIEDDQSISNVTLVLRDLQENVIAAVVAEKEGNAYVANFDESLFNDNYKYEVDIIATDISANEISSKISFTFAEVETFELSNVLPYPNPFNPDLETSKIRFNLEGRSVVKLYIHSITGKRLYTYSSIHDTGAQILEWDGRDDVGNSVAIGVYFAYLIVESIDSSDSVKKVLKLAVLK